MTLGFEGAMPRRVDRAVAPGGAGEHGDDQQPERARIAAARAAGQRVLHAGADARAARRPVGDQRRCRSVYEAGKRAADGAAARRSCALLEETRSMRAPLERRSNEPSPQRRASRASPGRFVVRSRRGSRPLISCAGCEPAPAATRPRRPLRRTPPSVRALFPVLYDELRRLARSRLRGGRAPHAARHHRAGARGLSAHAARRRRDAQRPRALPGLRRDDDALGGGRLRAPAQRRAARRRRRARDARHRASPSSSAPPTTRSWRCTRRSRRWPRSTRGWCAWWRCATSPG